MDFSKYEKTFPDFPLSWTAEAGVRQLYEAYRTIGLDADDYEGSTYKRIAQLKLLLSDGRLDETLRFAQS